MEHYPEPTARDYVEAVIDAAIEAVPLLAPLARFARIVVAPQIDQQRDAWLRQLGEVVAELEEMLDFETLADDPGFVSAVHRASEVAIMTHHDEKLDMLCEILKRRAIDGPTQDLVARRFIELVNTLQPEHFLFLTYAQDPREWFSAKGLPKPSTVMGSRKSMLPSAEVTFPPGTLDIVIGDAFGGPAAPWHLTTSEFLAEVARVPRPDGISRSLRSIRPRGSAPSSPDRARRRASGCGRR